MRLPERKQRFERPTVSLQSLGQRLSFIILLLAAVALLIAGRSNSPRIERLGAFISDLTAPVLEIASRPAQLINDGLNEADQFFSALSENHRLRNEVERLTAWQTTAMRLQSENSDFRRLLKLQDFPPAPSISARVVGDLGSPFVRTVLINAGGQQGLRKDMPVVDGDGLIGRIVSAGSRASRILLLSDINSRVPVRLEASGFQAVLTGDNDNLPMLSFLPALARPKPGDRIVTSGHGGVFPPGIPVGLVALVETAAGSQPVIRVKSFSDEDRLSFVRVLQFSPPQTIEMTPARIAPPLRQPGAPTP